MRTAGCPFTRISLHAPLVARLLVRRFCAVLGSSMPTDRRTPPSPSSSPRNLLHLDLKATERLVQDLGWPRYRAHQILRWLYRGRIGDIAQMTDLSKAERSRLKAVAVVGRSPHCRILRSEDGTRKFLTSLADGLLVESVLIPEAGRLTL